MENPAYYEYRRSARFGIVLVIALSVMGALLQYCFNIKQQMQQTSQRLTAVSMRLDQRLNFFTDLASGMQQAALLTLSQPITITDNSQVLTVLSLDNAVAGEQEILQAAAAERDELAMLLQLTPYFHLLTSQNAIGGVYYISERGFAYNGHRHWPDNITETPGFRVQPEVKNEPQSVFYSSADLKQVVLSMPLLHADQTLGRFVLILELGSILQPLYTLHPDSRFILFDQAGRSMNHSALLEYKVDRDVLQSQYLSAAPWSLAIVKPKSQLFLAGLSHFFWHAAFYSLLLALLLLAMQWRYKRRLVTPINRLIVHVDRLAAGRSQGVRRIPAGWSELFDKISRFRSGAKDVG